MRLFELMNVLTSSETKRGESPLDEGAYMERIIRPGKTNYTPQVFEQLFQVFRHKDEQ